jgi:DNA mismatch endonuclease (patch repair protein)
MDTMTKEQRANVMRHNRRNDTKPELMLRKALWHCGLRYRKNYKGLPGTPDIVLTRQHIAIFVDGDFWHGHGHEQHPAEQIKTHQEFWRRKISRNIERDKEVDDVLTESGWLVLRFWESDIKKNLDNCVKTVLDYVHPNQGRVEK